MIVRRLARMLAPAAALWLGLCAPAQARAPADERATTRIGEAADHLADPATQIAVTAALLAMTEAVLDFRVGPFARAVDEAGAGGGVRDVPADATVRDLAGDEAGRLSGRIARGTPRIMTAMAGMAGSLADMMPRLRAEAERMRQSLPSR